MSKLEFSGQHANEKIIVVFRRHLIAMRKGFYSLLGFFCIGSIPFLIWSSNINLLWGSLIGFALGLLVMFYHWVGWYFSVFVVTNERIRQTSQKGLFSKSVIDLNLSKIQNISYNIPGFTGEFLGFGTIVLQTIVGDMVINNVAHCERVYDELSNAIYHAGGSLDVDLNNDAKNIEAKEENE